MTDLHDIFEAKKIESEFQNREVHKDEITAPYQPLLDDLKIIRQKSKSCEFQANQLVDRLRHIQKNYFDDMTIIDTDNSSAVVHAPWKSSIPYTREQYASWNVAPKSSVMKTPAIIEVAIRKNGNGKQVQVLDSICKRLRHLDEMIQTLSHKKLEIKRKLNTDFSGTLASDLE